MDEEEAIARIYLNETKRVRQALSHRQHYKSVLEHFQAFYSNYDIDDNKIYASGHSFLEVLQEAISNTVEIDKAITFKIDVGRNKLPKFEYEGDITELFFTLLQRGLKVKVKKRGKDIETYLKRLEEEADVIVNANFVDYFLILWDMIKWACRSS
jgi:DNA polymerase III alpha subunit